MLTVIMISLHFHLNNNHCEVDAFSITWTLHSLKILHQ